MLPRDMAKSLIGTLAHPLQQAVLDEEGKRVVAGYGVLQPRVGVSVQSSRASRFAALFSGHSGIDPYTTAVSDVYQDLFGEGIFTGKGIYDVDVFHRVTGQAFPENKILSHDLIEGLYARAGLVTDIELIDGYPAKYQAYMRRLHRWTRGDWQIASWLFKDLSLLAKWKIGDNLRRSLEAVSQVLLLFLAFTVLPQNPWYWSALVIFAVFWPSILFLSGRLLKREPNRQSFGFELAKCAWQGGFQLSTLAFHAYIQLDAILRSLARQFFTHRKLLEWETAADAEKRFNLDLKTSVRTMWPVGVIIAVFVLAVNYFAPARLAGLLPLLLFWALSPWAAYRLSLPLAEAKEDLTAEQKNELQLWARQIWGFFEEYVSPAENWLPPDNVQMDPPNGIAHRTSPTNVGLAILANRAARDWGYLTLSQTLNRIKGTLATLERLPRWKGHFYNWYDTRTLAPLEPHYISTVDSGNLVVSFLTLAHGLEEMPEESILGPHLLSGLKETYDLFQGSQAGEASPEWQAWEEELLKVQQHPQDLFAWQEFLFRVALPPQEADTFWAKRLGVMLENLKGEWATYFPFLEFVTAAEKAHPSSSLAALAGASPRELLKYCRDILDQGEKSQEKLSPEKREALQRSHQALEALLGDLAELRGKLHQMALDTDFQPLYSKERQLFSIGYHLNEQILDRSYYDLLASEARQASFMAIAKRDVPQEHWFHLGRTLTGVNGERCLVSWSGTMFEFLMPLLFMRNYPGTLWDETYRAVVKIQRDYAEKRGVPWGISESGYCLYDSHLNYQYKAFGVPGLGLKRGLIRELVVAPYATFMALQVALPESMENLRRMVRLGFAGRFGLYEAIDFTRERLPLKKNFGIVKSYMAHHQGMSLLALSNILQDNRMQKRFHRDPLVQATELLLQERVPVAQILPPQYEMMMSSAEKLVGARADEERHFAVFKDVNTRVPLTHFVSNGQYAVMLTNSGSGFSRFRETAISRWREDTVRDHWGMYFYIKNLNSGEYWSATYQPCRVAGEEYQVTFAADRVEYYRKDGTISTKTEVTVSPEDAAELRRITLTNHGSHEREVEVTSYFETVLTRFQDDSAHPAFANLFIQTEFANASLLALRRPRRPEDGETWLMHTVALEGKAIGSLEYETDRARFLGRGSSLASPQALQLNQPLSNSVGAVLNPIMSLRQRVCVKPGQTVKVTFSTGIGKTKEEVMRLAEKYRDPVLVNRAFELAWTQSKMELNHLNLPAMEAGEALNLGGHIVYPSPARRELAEYLTRNRLGQSSLWPYAISGDLPIVLLRVSEIEHLEFIRYFLKINEYWRMKGLQVDLVILNEDEQGYFQTLQDRLRDLIGSVQPAEGQEMPGKIVALQKSHLPEEIVVLLFSAARLVFAAEKGSGPVQIRKRCQSAAVAPGGAVEGEKWPAAGPQPVGEKKPAPYPEGESFKQPEIDSLLFFNGLGGFSPDGREYVVHLKEDQLPPVPWINVVANPRFGFQISESGAGYTWSGNSRENKLTPWSNDPVLDPVGEGILIRDEMSGAVWSPTPAPLREGTPYQITYGQGYVSFRHSSHGIDMDYLLYVSIDHPLKIARLTLHNSSGQKRRLSASYFADWVLGVAREQTAQYLVTDFDIDSETLLARNTYQEEFAGRVVFLSGFGGTLASFTGDREEWLGRNGDFSHPQGLRRERLSGQYGAGFDACGVLQRVVELEPGQRTQLVFLLGEGETREGALNLARQFRSLDSIERAYQESQEFWDSLLGKIQVRTPEKSLDLLMNRWLMYQSLVCRIWARSAFYQSGGAYGFRDQLQDAMSMVQQAPEYTREQILRHCARQFVEGDVQHWWHPETGKGIRTRFSDDLLWLPYVTADYLEHTEDYSLLDETVPYITDELLAEGEDERYSIPRVAEEKGTVYDHCLRALRKGLVWGEHGLPLIGSGDWNDGFSRIGHRGKGESVWLGWFILATLKRFARVCEHRGDAAQAAEYRNMAAALNESLENSGWDGAWYRRAYFDDGTPVGSVRNRECQIDAIAQSWSVISGGARPARAESAMKAMESYLWKKEEGVLLLLAPPFENSSNNPGYIQGYVPGVRENGGQYTHGAIWSVLAWTMLGEGNKALQLFNMLNPINHARTPHEVARYKVEPYVMAADVYAIHPHTGRGGWTWYTGAAGWMYQVALEGILGLSRQGDRLSINPCIPEEWPGYEIDYVHGSSRYRIQVENPGNRMNGVGKIFLDGKAQAEDSIRLLDDGKEHQLRVVLGNIQFR